MKIKIEGAKELIKQLQQLAPSAARRVMRKAMTRGVNPVVKAAKEMVPTRTRLLKKSIGHKVRTYPRKGIIYIAVGPRTGFSREIEINGYKKFVNPVRYGHLVEGGTSHSMAKPFLKPALEGKAAAVVAIVSRVIKEELPKEIAKGKKR